MSSHDTTSLEIELECPYCPAGKRSKLSFNTDKGVFNCFRCGFSGSINSLKTSHKDLYESVKDYVALSLFSRVDRISRPNLVESTQLIKDDLNTAEVISESDEFYAYLESRGWDHYAIDVYSPLKCDLVKLRNRVIIPVSVGGRVVFYSARDITGRAFNKYYNPSVTKDFVFTSQTSVDCVYSSCGFIGEGVFDMFKVPNGVALLGKTLGKPQHNQLYSTLKQKSNIYICLDPGTELQSNSIAQELESWFPAKPIFIMDWVSNTKSTTDLGDLSKHMSSRELVDYIRSNSTQFN